MEIQVRVEALISFVNSKVHAPENNIVNKKAIGWSVLKQGPNSLHIVDGKKRIQAMKGGFEKNPKSKFCDQKKYWASSIANATEPNWLVENIA